MRSSIFLLLFAIAPSVSAQPMIQPIHVINGDTEETQGGCINGNCEPQFVPQGQQPTSLTYTKANPAVVRITNKQGRQSILGSGTLISKDEILTCAHLFHEFRGEIAVYFYDNQGYRAKLISVAEDVDLALLRIAPAHVHPVQIAERDPTRGERILSAGYGPDGHYATNSGTVLSYASYRDDNQINVLCISGRARRGDSGGPMFNSQGHLTGVLFGTNNQEVDGTCCLFIHRFLGRLRGRSNNPRSPPKESIGDSPLAPIPDEAGPVPVETPINDDCEERVKKLQEELSRSEQEVSRIEALRREQEKNYDERIQQLQEDYKEAYIETEQLEENLDAQKTENTSLLDKLETVQERLTEALGRPPKTVEKIVEKRVADPVWKWISGVAIGAGVPAIIAVPFLYIARRRLKKRLSTIIGNKIQKGQGIAPSPTTSSTKTRPEINSIKQSIEVNYKARILQQENRIRSLEAELTSSQQALEKLKEFHEAPINQPIPIPLNSVLENTLRQRIKQLEASLQEANQTIIKLKELHVEIPRNVPAVSTTENIYVDRPLPEREAESYREAIRRLIPQYSNRTMPFAYAVELIEGVKEQLWTGKKIGTTSTDTKSGWKVE